MILDATSGNRTMWEVKEVPYIVYIDIAALLALPPTVICDNRQTPFRDGSFSAIFFDPPHYSRPTMYSRDPGRVSTPAYYGRFENITDLLSSIHRAQKEFKRILKDEGILFFKWSEGDVDLYKLTPLLREWVRILSLEYRYHRKMGRESTQWTIWVKRWEE